MRVAVIGMGTMGAPIARHVLEAGHDVAVHNRTREREAPLVAAGARAAESPAAVARGAETVIVCVSDTPDVEAVLFGPDGVAGAIPSDGVVVDCSTISAAATRDFAARLAERGVGLVDAPLSGGSEGAERGTLTVFVGGEDAHVAAVRPLLETFGSRITHLGPPGAGQAGKAVNQVIIAGAYASLAEGIALGRAEGLPLDRLLEALAAGAAASWVLENRAGNMVQGRFPLGFRVALHRKDLGIALDAAASAGLSLPVAELVAREEDELIRSGHGGEDVSALARVVAPDA
jgi:3-hydroxyisobutyrate dehydrogenase